MKKVLVLGKGKSGLAAKKILQSKGYMVEMVDDADSVFLKRKLASFCFAVTSPGFAPKNKWILACKKANLKVVSELDLGLESLKTNNVVAVTGTNGKTTIVSLIGDILKQQKTTFVLGNIGTPLCNEVEHIKKQDFVVLEVSSFMLEQSKKLKPKIAIISNITPDHVEWHGSEKNYVRAKLKILKNKDGVAIVDFADPLLPLYKAKSKAKLFFISTKKRVQGAYIRGKNIFFFDGNINELVAKVHHINLIGLHNQKNALMAICAAKLCGISNSNIQNALQSFSGLAHRIQKVGVVGGITFVNDSKSTNADSTIQAVKTFGRKKPIVLVGGYDKGLPASELLQFLAKRAKHTVLFGAAGQRFVSEAKNRKKFCLVKNLNDALEVATSKAKKGDIVLLSPACSSFDEFGSYEERGERFEQLVKELESRITNKKTSKTTV